MLNIIRIKLHPSSPVLSQELMTSGHDLQLEIIHHPCWNQSSDVNPGVHNPQNTYNPISRVEDIIHRESQKSHKCSTISRNFCPTNCYLQQSIVPMSSRRCGSSLTVSNWILRMLRLWKRV